MSFRVSGKNLDIGEALRTRVNARVAEALTKYFDGGYSGHVTVGKDGFGFRTECAIHLDSGITLHTEGMAADAYSSADQAALRIEKRLRLIKAPTLLLWGEQDRIMPLAYAESFAKGITGPTTIRAIADAGHLAELDQPTAVAQAITAFLDKG